MVKKFTTEYVYAGHKGGLVKFVAKPYVDDETAIENTEFMVESGTKRFTHNVTFDTQRYEAWTKEVHAFFENGCGFPYLAPHCVNSEKGDNNELLVISTIAASAYEKLLGPHLALREYMRDNNIEILLTYQNEDYNNEYADVWLPVNVASSRDMLPSDWWNDYYMLRD